jgi:hypothetical protein
MQMNSSLPKLAASAALWAELGCRLKDGSIEPDLYGPRFRERNQRWEGSRPRDPPSPRPTPFPDQRRNCTVGLGNVFAARGGRAPSPSAAPRQLTLPLTAQAPASHHALVDAVER